MCQARLGRLGQEVGRNLKSAAPCPLPSQALTHTYTTHTHVGTLAVCELLGSWVGMAAVGTAAATALCRACCLATSSALAKVRDSNEAGNWSRKSVPPQHPHAQHPHAQGSLRQGLSTAQSQARAQLRVQHTHIPHAHSNARNALTNAGPTCLLAYLPRALQVSVKKHT